MSDIITVRVADLPEVTTVSDSDWLIVDSGIQTAKITSQRYNSAASGSARQYANEAATSAASAALSADAAEAAAESFGDIEIVENQAELATSTKTNVLVLHNDSRYGDRGACLFVAQTGVDKYGYHRSSDGKYMTPVPDQDMIATANPPIESLMAVIKTWVGNPNVKHLTAGSIDDHSLFGTVCSQTDGYWSMDCSAFTSAVLMGITYDNSRCVLGTAADNIPGDYFVGNQFPPSQYLPARSKGGLSAAETAMWLAEHKRLYSFPSDPAKAVAQLQFGDIIFGSNSIYPRYYYHIEHIMFVLGTVPSQNAVIVAESIDLGYAPTYYEQIGAHITPVLLRDSGTGLVSDYYQVWGRPDYSHLGQKRDSLIPKTSLSFKYNPFFLDATLVCRGSSDSSTVPGGKLMTDRYSAGTPDFYPAIPGSVVSYTGASRCDRGVYLCRVHEFDVNQKLIKSTTIAYATNGNPATNPVTIGSTTRFLKFTFGIQSNTMSDRTVGIWLSNIDDCEITMTLPS